jgi:CMP-N-acetylneuraminic acid synthetase
MNKSKVVAIIPARKASKRLPNKNIKLLCGKPLITYTIEEALKVDFIDEIIITTDDSEVVRIIIKNLQPKIKIIHRPPELAKDKTPIWEVVEHACQDYNDKIIIILLQPTSPLRTKEDIEDAYKIFDLNVYRFAVVSGFWEYPSHYIHINGAIYIHYLELIVSCKTFIFKNTIFHMMPKERSVDIDLQSDFDLAERYMRMRMNEK